MYNQIDETVCGKKQNTDMGGYDCSGRVSVNLKQSIDSLINSDYFKNGVAYQTYIPPQTGEMVDFPPDCMTKLREVLKTRGISQLYSHQREAYDSVMAGQNTVVVTPTASGKTLCYNLPVLQTILKQPETRALYLFPTKALAQDQLSELQDILPWIGENIRVYTYDGDTPVDARRSIRHTANLVITNPDMLHSGILPHHTKWISLFENLKFVVLDEIHSYRGVFGSHMAHVLHRLQRICRHYDSAPVFIASSATIANPRELAERLVGKPFHAIDKNGAPAGGKYFIFYNPPVVDENLGIRRSSINESLRIASHFLNNGFKTICFARSRLKVEILGRYLKDDQKKRVQPRTVKTYRGGYLPGERRDIEKGLREGSIDGVVSTNAMELGVDIGELDVCVMAGYPGSIASTWQQAGRAGRRNRDSVAILVASSAPVDQYLVKNPRYFMEQSPEMGLINPDNVIIKAEHLKCACFELPVRQEEYEKDPEALDILEILQENRFVHRVEDTYYWMAESFPAQEISLRSVAGETVAIMDETEARPRVIGEMDRTSAQTMLYEGAIYLHQDQQYQVVRFDWEGCRAYVKRVNVDYYTDADLAVDLKVLNVAREEEAGGFVQKWGEVMVTQVPTVYKKIKYRTHENIGYGTIALPEEEMHTSSFWIAFKPAVLQDLTNEQKEYALVGLANLVQNLASIFLMCDPQDLRVTPQVKAVETEMPTLFVYDRYPGGTGLAEGLFNVSRDVLKAALELAAGCSCRDGCPSCVGPPQLVGEQARELVVKLLSRCLA